MKFIYWSIDKLPGLKPSEQNLLKAHGITNTQQLLANTSNPQARESLAIQLNIGLNYVKKWGALADLARVPSVGCQYCGLLLHLTELFLSLIWQ